VKVSHPTIRGIWRRCTCTGCSTGSAPPGSWSRHVHQLDRHLGLLSGQTPDHSTIAAFVTLQGKDAKQCFRDVLAVGIRAGLNQLEHVAVDGSKVEAGAGRDSVRSEEKIRSWLVI